MVVMIDETRLSQTLVSCEHHTACGPSLVSPRAKPASTIWQHRSTSPSQRSPSTSRCSNAQDWSREADEPSSVLARSTPAPLVQVADWAEQYRRIWDRRFDRIDEYVRDLQHPHDTKAMTQ